MNPQRNSKDTSVKERKFLREYFKHFSTTKAAESVGFTGSSAIVSGSRILRKTKDSGVYAEEAQRALDSAGISLESVLFEIDKLARANMDDFITVDADGQADINLANLTRDQKAAIQEITVDSTGGAGDGERRKVLRTRFKLADKGSNLERLLKHFTGPDRVELTGLGGGPIKTSIEVSFVTPNVSQS